MFFLSNPRIDSWFKVIVTHPGAVLVARSSSCEPSARRDAIERILREIFIENRNPLKRETLDGMLDYFAGRHPLKVRLRRVELWVPDAAAKALLRMGAELHSKGATSWVAATRKPGIGTIIDWLVESRPFIEQLRSTGEQ